MKLKTFFYLVACAASMHVSAGVVTHEFNNGDDLSAWQTDRCAPASFAISNNELVLGIDGAEVTKCDADPFFSTQGMKLNTGMSDYLGIDMFIDGTNWTADGRYGGIWGVAYDASDAISYYPILEYFVTNGVGSLQAWDGDNGWVDIGFRGAALDSFNNLAFSISGGVISYLVNGNNVFTTSNGGHSYFGEVILNAKNAGTSYNVRYDNLTYNTPASVPEPATIAILGAGLLFVGAARKRRQTTAK